MRSLLELLPAPPADEPHVLVGGVAASTLLPQLLANIIQRPIHVPRHPADVAALGAAAIGAAHLERASPEGAHSATHGDTPPLAGHLRFTPDPALASAYATAYATFCGLHPALRGTFKSLASLRAGGRSEQ